MKKGLVLAIVAGMLSAGAISAEGSVYYVSQSSAGSGNGTSYINRASLSCHNSGSGVFADLAADTVVLCGNITSQVVTPDGGSDGSVVTYDGNADVYDPAATDATITAYPGSPNRTCFLISNKNYITVQNLAIDADKTNLAVDNSSGIKIFKSSHITIDNCDIQESGNGIDIVGTSEYVTIIRSYIHDEPSSGIRMMKEWETSNYPSNITIGGSSETGNTIKDCGGYAGSGDVDSDIWVSGPCSQITIGYNHLYATADSFRGFSGVYANGADDMLIEYNIVHGHNSEKHRSGINIKADHMWQSNRIVIRDNHVYDQTSVRQYSESCGIRISMDWEQVYVYNNYVHDCQGGINFNQGWQSENNSNGLNPSKGYCWSNTIESTAAFGIRLGGNGSDTTSEIYFLNNTIYRAAIMASDWWHTGIALTLSTATGVHVENNIMFDSRPNAGTKYSIAGHETSDYVANNNQYHQTGAIPHVYEYGNSNCIPCTWNSVYNPFSGDSDSAGDPLFNNSSESDFTLSPDSPCIDTGAFLTTITSNTANSQTSFTVADADYFYDGWDLPGETGDVIKTEHGQITTIQTIDYDTHTMTVSPAIDIVNGEGVALEYTGSAPDIGAYEYYSPGELVDLNDDGKVDLLDFAVLALWWDNENACSSPSWCGGGDFDMNGTVDMLDLTYFTESWLW